MKRTIILLLFSLLLIVVVGYGSVFADGGNKTEASEGISQEITLMVTNLPTSIDPLQDTGLSALTAYSLLYDRLIDIDKSGNTIPSLALSWKPIKPTVWRLELRQGVFFHNGERFNAKTVQSVIMRALHGTESRQKAQISLIKDVQIVNDYAIDIITSEPWSLLPNRLSRLWIYPTEYFNQVGLEGFLKKPIGSGSYRFVKWQQDNYLILEKNDKYWREQQSEIKKITLRHTPDMNARINALESGEADMAFIIDPEQIVRLEKLGYKTLNQPLGQAYIYFFRTTLKSPVADVRVRRAINYAIDVDTIIKSLFLGMASKLEGQPVGSDAFGYDSSIKAYPYDPQMAKKLLAEAGYPQGFTIAFDGTSGMAPKDKEVAELIADQLAQIGIHMQINLNERGVYLEKMMNAKMSPIWSISLNYAPTMDLFGPMNNATSFTGHKSHSDPAFDSLYLRWLAAFDQKEQLKIGREMLKYYHDEALALFLWQSPGLYSISPKVQGIEMNPDYTINLLNAVVK